VSVLLDDIINLAIDGKQPLPDILRKCLLLGHELKNDRLKEWANQELNGYKSSKDIPEYRHVQGIAKGHFFGAYGGGELKNYPIPPLALEEKHRHWAREVYLMQGVSAYEDILRSSDETTITYPWPGDMVLYYQQKFLDGYGLISAWLMVSKNTFVEVLDTVRNRTLNMALQLKDELGTSYADLRKIDSKETQANIQHIIFQNTGGNTNVAFGQANLDASGQSQTVIAVGDRQALDKVLSSAGLDKSDLDSLTEAIQVDGKKPGNKVREWIKEKGSKVLSGGIKVGTKIGSEILTAWIKQHYGF
jgi:AbiTii